MSSEKPVLYKLTGARKGDDGEFFGFKFKDGQALIPAEAHRSCGHVLSQHYAAFPAEEADRINGPAKTEGEPKGEPAVKAETSEPIAATGKQRR